MTDAATPKPAETGEAVSYLAHSRRPLQVLIFLLPLIVLYELGLWLILADHQSGHVSTVGAHRRIVWFFSQFGIESGGLFLGGLAIILVLLIWHLLNRDPWRVSVKTAGIMAAEAIVLALPLLAIGQLINQQLAAAPTGSLEAMSLPGKMTISIGAGLYEELLFRMMIIAAVHTLLVDVAKASNRLGAGAAIVVSAALFTWYHPLGSDADPGRISLQKVLFFFAAGVYFGLIYLGRGFGIVVGAHAVYDLIVVALQESG